ncbi:kinase-like domain [Trichoderma arundinaceum]|uniref:Kinase-like domain n=1 Tax=Trichoderma arundinaceum TaxID=490622 RepID=A0A395N9I7_TRIAR|nr:kinase-like domain [Trichoderma arundinaceum]
MEASISALSGYQISQFFSNNTPITQQRCNYEAERITGAPAIPSTVQGGTSYTVITGDSVVQFRADHSALDLQLLRCVEQAYAGFVPCHSRVGELGKLYIYAMDNIGGISMYLAREQLNSDNHRLLQRTLKDYARFFSSAWHNMPEGMPSPSRMMLLNDYSSQFTELRAGLPPRFHQILGYLTSHLPRLFANDWPMVPNHTDLLENKSM